MKRSLVMALLAVTSCTSSPGGEGAGGGLGPYCGKGGNSYVGSYTMSGVMEVGSQLRINADGSYDFYLAYGANDQNGHGCWTQTDRLIALFPGNSRKIAPDHTPDTRGFTGIILEKDGRDLLWRIAGSHHVGRYER